MALTAAEQNGDPTPDRVEWAYATRGQIADLLDFEVGTEVQDQQQVLIQLTGEFENRGGHRPRGITVFPKGSNVELVVSIDTWEGTDYSIGNLDLDLRTLGTVYTSEGSSMGLPS